MLDGLVSLLYPPVCLACAMRTPGPDVLLCPACAATLAEADADALAAEACDEALTSAAARWAYTPDGPLAPVLHALKYGNRPRYGRLLGPALAALLPEGTDALVPLPLHRTRFVERGYNQAEEIARALSDASGVPVRPELLRRARATATQTKRDRDARAANVSGAFEASAEAAGLRLVLVDDVVTTGATARAAARVLVGAGAARVGLVALAHTA